MSDKASQKVLPWNTFPASPGLSLSKAQTHGLIQLANGVELWHAIFGIPLKQSLATGKAPVFFLHGGIGQSGYYGHQIEYFSANYTVIVFDHRGHGQSPLGNDSNLTYDKLADDLVGILDLYAIPKASLVGWSDGAVMTWSVLARHPHRVERAWAYGAVDDYRKTDGERVSQIPMVGEYFTRVTHEWKALHPKQDFDQFFSVYLSMWSKDPVWTAETFRNVPVRGETADAPIVWVVTGDYDDWIPAEMHRRFQSYVRNSSFLEMPGTGHLAFIQTPALYNRLVESFLEDGKAMSSVGGEAKPSSLKSLL